MIFLKKAPLNKQTNIQWLHALLEATIPIVDSRDRNGHHSLCWKSLQLDRYLSTFDMMIRIVRHFTGTIGTGLEERKVRKIDREEEGGK